MGVHDKKLQEKLLADRELSLEKSTEICKLFELNKEHTRLMQEGPSVSGVKNCFINSVKDVGLSMIKIKIAFKKSNQSMKKSLIIVKNA